jgi:hypothetical protein
MNGGKCYVCGEDGHRASRCPELCDPLREGFFKGGGGGGGDCDDHDHDDRVVVKLDQWVTAGASAVLRRKWKSHKDSHQLNARYSLHAGSYAARLHSAALCRA